MSKKVTILDNPSWHCMPSMPLVEDQGPRLCCCRYHSSKERFQYMHPPTSPFGSASFDGDNTLAQVLVVVPRTVRQFRALSH
jgi:hypothetical protein